jgi:hypothetical protein
MTTARAAVAAAAAAVAAAGCVDRRFIIESNVPSAQVYVDNRPVGAAPADAPFEYYGYYNITLVHPNHEVCTNRVKVKAPWYAYPPFDFVVEVLWPFQVSDVRRYYFNLEPLRPVQAGELLDAADGLRGRGQALPPQSVPLPPKPAPVPPPDAAPPPGVFPAPVQPNPVPPGSVPSGSR